VGSRLRKGRWRRHGARMCHGHFEIARLTLYQSMAWFFVDATAVLHAAVQHIAHQPAFFARGSLRHSDPSWAKTRKLPCYSLSFALTCARSKPCNIGPKSYLRNVAQRGTNVSQYQGNGAGTLPHQRLRPHLLLIPEFCPGGQRQRLTLIKSTLLV